MIPVLPTAKEASWLKRYLPVLASCFAFFAAFFFFKDGIISASYIVVKLKRFFQETIWERDELMRQIKNR